MKKEECVFCKIYEDSNYLKIYEDDKTISVLNKTPAAIGHVLIIPKEHYTIIEQVPDFEIGHMFNIANKISSAIFEALNMQGTNIIVENGVAAGQETAHFAINIIPRRENDGLNLTWQPKKLSEDEMSTVELKLKEAAKSIGEFEKQKKESISLDNKEKKQIKGEDDYLIKQLRRVP
jgi:histidine triad (HIT) family protein